MWQNCVPLDFNAYCLGSVTDKYTYTFCERESLIPAVNGNSLPHGKLNTCATDFMDLLKLSCMTVTLQYVSLLVLKSSLAEDALGPEVRVLMEKQSALPCWHQTNWHQMEPRVLPQGPAGLNSCQSSRGQSEGSPRFTNKQHEQTSNQSCTAFVACLLFNLADVFTFTWYLFSKMHTSLWMHLWPVISCKQHGT